MILVLYNGETLDGTYSVEEILNCVGGSFGDVIGLDISESWWRLGGIEELVDEVVFWNVESENKYVKRILARLSGPLSLFYLDAGFRKHPIEKE